MNGYVYSYRSSDASSGVRFVESVTWALRPGEIKGAHFVAQFYYQTYHDGVSDYRSRFRQTLADHCNLVRIKVVADPDAAPGGMVIREYRLGYASEKCAASSSTIARLQSVQQADGRGNILPPLRFEYYDIDLPPRERLLPVKTVVLGMGKVEPHEMQDVTFADANGDSLLDLVHLRKDGCRCALNLGRDRFSGWKPFQGASPSFSLSSPGCQLIDLQGDGSIEFVRCVFRGTTEYYSLAPVGTFPTQAVEFKALKKFAGYAPEPLSGDDILVLDTDFDKAPDLMRLTHLGLRIVRNRPKSDGTRFWVEDDFVPPSECGLQPSEVLRNGNSWVVQSADLNGDRLVDLVRIRRSSKDRITLEGWLNAGRRFERIERTLSSVNVPLTPDEVFRWSDLNGDGLCDLALVAPGKVAVWFGLGDSFSDPFHFEGPQYKATSTQILIQDLNGNGSADLIWWSPANTSDENRLRYYDFCPVRPNLLKSIDNGIGERITLQYRSSTDYYVAAAGAGDSWQSVSPVAVPVLSRVIQSPSLDLDHDGCLDEYTTDYIYRDAYYDGFEKEFRGFQFVVKVEWGDDRPDRKRDIRSPTLVTRFQFHTGAPQGIETRFNEVAGHYEEPMKGKTLWAETCSLNSCRFLEAIRY